LGSLRDASVAPCAGASLYPGGVVNNSIYSNPNAITTTITYKTTGKPA
jgi:hypothetical protein